MIRGFYTAVSGIKSQQSGMDAIANNIANISTTGYKAQHTAFSSLLYKSINGGSGGIAMGHGARISGTKLTLSQGDLTATGQAYDFAVDGEGFFALQGADKNDRVYTRDGSFPAFAKRRQNVSRRRVWTFRRRQGRPADRGRRSIRCDENRRVWLPQPLCTLACRRKCL